MDINEINEAIKVLVRQRDEIIVAQHTNTVEGIKAKTFELSDTFIDVEYNFSDGIISLDQHHINIERIKKMEDYSQTYDKGWKARASDVGANGHIYSYVWVGGPLNFQKVPYGLKQHFKEVKVEQ